MPEPPVRPSEGSTIRLLTGSVLVIVAVAGAIIGFVHLIGVLEGGGYGTPAMRTALVILGAAGACLAAGIATVIWEIAKRFEGR